MLFNGNMTIIAFHLIFDNHARAHVLDKLYFWDNLSVLRRTPNFFVSVPVSVEYSGWTPNDYLAYRFRNNFVNVFFRKGL